MITYWRGTNIVMSAEAQWLIQQAMRVDGVKRNMHTDIVVRDVFDTPEFTVETIRTMMKQFSPENMKPYEGPDRVPE